MDCTLTCFSWGAETLESARLIDACSIVKTRSVATVIYIFAAIIPGESIHTVTSEST